MTKVNLFQKIYALTNDVIECLIYLLALFFQFSEDLIKINYNLLICLI